MGTPEPAVSTARCDDALVLSLVGGGLEAATILHGELEDAVGSGRRRVVVDLVDSQSVDLTIVGVLLAALRRLRDAHGSLVLLTPPSSVSLGEENTLALDDYFRVEHSLPAAIAATAA